MPRVPLCRLLDCSEGSGFKGGGHFRARRPSRLAATLRVSSPDGACNQARMAFDGGFPASLFFREA